MHIIIEGLDGSGKTTIGTALSEYFGWEFYRPLKTFSGDPEYLKNILPGHNDVVEDLVVAEMVRKMNLNLISDRGFMSAIVYRAFWRIPSGLFHLNYRLICEYSAMMPETLILLIERNIPDCYKLRSDRFTRKQFEYLKKLFDSYACVFTGFGIKIIRIPNYTDNVNKAIAKSKKTIESNL